MPFGIAEKLLKKEPSLALMPSVPIWGFTCHVCDQVPVVYYQNSREMLKPEMQYSRMYVAKLAAWIASVFVIQSQDQVIDFLSVTVKTVYMENSFI